MKKHEGAGKEEGKENQEMERTKEKGRKTVKVVGKHWERISNYIGVGAESSW